MTGRRVVCLLPARDGAGDVPGWIASVARFADAVVALDDGSTDDTAALLEAEPLVRILLRNPPRPGYWGWDDSANRNRLLEAAATLGPDWILSLDIDERISPDDAAALRHFVDTEAEPGRAYGFSVFRMIDDVEHYDRLELVTFRLFSWAPEQALPARRLHFAPVPTSIREERWAMTTLRIQHLATMTEERRRARWAKYLESDPARRWQVDYTYALVPPGVVRPWPRRPADLPVLRAGDVVAPWDLDMLDLEGPILSVVIVVRLDDEVDAMELVRTLVDEDAGVPTEILVADVAGMGTAELAAAEFPSVQALTLNRDFSPGQARDLALRTARGDYVLVLNPADRVARGALMSVVKAHEAGHGLVTGAAANESRSATGWATYFLDHAASLGPKPGALAVAPTRASVPREAAIALGTGRLDGPAQPSVCEELFADGFSAVHVNGLTFVHSDPGTPVRRFLRDRFRRGRALARLTRPASSGRTTSSLVAVRQRLHTIRAGVGNHPECLGPYRRVAPLVATGLAATWVGAAYERLATLAPR